MKHSNRFKTRLTEDQIEIDQSITNIKLGQKYELLIPQTRQTHIISQTPPYLLNLTPLVIVSVAK